VDGWGRSRIEENIYVSGSLDPSMLKACGYSCEPLHTIAMGAVFHSDRSACIRQSILTDSSTESTRTSWYEFQDHFRQWINLIYRSRHLMYGISAQILIRFFPDPLIKNIHVFHSCLCSSVLFGPWQFRKQVRLLLNPRPIKCNLATKNLLLLARFSHMARWSAWSTMITATKA